MQKEKRGKNKHNPGDHLSLLDRSPHPIDSLFKSPCADAFRGVFESMILTAFSLPGPICCGPGAASAAPAAGRYA